MPRPVIGVAMQTLPGKPGGELPNCWIMGQRYVEALRTVNATPWLIPLLPHDPGTMADIFEHEHYRARNMLVEVPDDDVGSVTLAGVMPKLSATPGKIRWSGHRNGQDTRQVLEELLHMPQQEIDALARDGVIGCDHTASTTKRSRRA